VEGSASDVSEEPQRAAKRRLSAAKQLQQHHHHQSGSGSGSAKGGELSPSQFTEVLIRVAHRRYAPASSSSLPPSSQQSRGHGRRRRLSSSSRALGAKVGSKPPQTLAWQLEKLIESHVLPRARLSNVDGFRGMIANNEMEGMLAKHKDPLRLLFKAAASHDKKDKDVRHVNLKEFTHLLDTRKALGGSLTRIAVTNIFNNSQIEDSHRADASTEVSSQQLNFSEFKEALAACAQLRDPNPYLAFEQVVENFLFRLEPKAMATKMRKMSQAAALSAAFAVPGSSTGSGTGT
jgi:hypothetical protein